MEIVDYKSARHNERREAVLESKRNFRRFDLPLIVKFRSTYGASHYSLGLAKNISCGGLSLETRDFNFIRFAKLELELRFPQGDAYVSLFGDVVWKKQDGNISYAGIKFRVEDDALKNEISAKISCNVNIPVDSVLGRDTYRQKTGKPVPVQAKKKPVSSAAPRKSGITKQYLGDGSGCRVTFILPGEAAPEARSVTIAGDFNDWNTTVNPMKKLDSGDFSTSLDLACKKEYRFKYLIDGCRWENDWSADKYTPNPFGSDDSLIIV